MVIGVIGAGISGLIAGRKLAQAGHDVTVIERNRSIGGKLATYKAEDIPLDYGLSYLTASGAEFRKFLSELEKEKKLRKQVGRFSLFDGEDLVDLNPNKPELEYWTGKEGIHVVAKSLSRWVDVKSEEKAGGITHIGAERTKKRPWMINLTDISVFECDAVIISTPAPEAYGILQTTQDETPARRIIRYIDEVQYNPCYSLLATFDAEVPSWRGVDVEDSKIKWISNESLKQDAPSKTGLVIQSTSGFARKHALSTPEEIKKLMLERAADVTNSTWLTRPEWSKLHYWKYFKAINPMDEFFLELEMEEAPLALIGDYLGGNTAEDAFLSGLYLAEYWINKYSKVTV